jgi:hypothetical protein
MNEPNQHMIDQVQNPEFLVQFSLNAIRSGLTPDKVAELGQEIMDQLFEEKLAEDVARADQEKMGFIGPIMPDA